MGSFGAVGGALTGDFGLLGAEPPIKGPDLGAEGLLGNFADDPEAELAGSFCILIRWRSVNHPTYHQHSRIQPICSLRRLLFFSARSQAGCKGSGRWEMHRAALLRRGRAWSYPTQGVGVLLPSRAQAFFLSFLFLPGKEYRVRYQYRTSSPNLSNRTVLRRGTKSYCNEGLAVTVLQKMENKNARA